MIMETEWMRPRLKSFVAAAHNQKFGALLFGERWYGAPKGRKVKNDLDEIP